MAAPERSEADISPIPIKAELITALADIERQLELADENENTVERFFKRGELLEAQDLLQALVFGRPL